MINTWDIIKWKTSQFPLWRWVFWKKTIERNHIKYEWRLTLWKEDV